MRQPLIHRGAVLLAFAALHATATTSASPELMRWLESIGEARHGPALAAADFSTVVRALPVGLCSGWLY
jgi:hypothetical protein